MEPLESILDRLWLWGMKVNSLQASMDYGKWGFAPSTLTTEQAIEQTGIRNVLMGGGVGNQRADTGLDAFCPSNYLQNELA